jgi:hypothetical protein
MRGNVSELVGRCHSRGLDLADLRRVETVVRDDGLQGTQGRARLGAPARDIGELPPPQRFLDGAGAIVLQSVGHAGGDVGEIVGET